MYKKTKNKKGNACERQQRIDVVNLLLGRTEAAQQLIAAGDSLHHLANAKSDAQGDPRFFTNNDIILLKCITEAEQWRSFFPSSPKKNDDLGQKH